LFPGKEVPEDWMQNMAAEMNLSETSFIWDEEGKWKIRYFTPSARYRCADMRHWELLISCSVTEWPEKMIS
jgi:predicted PhzF superfamily epimerase YddE/YHI9